MGSLVRVTRKTMLVELIFLHVNIMIIVLLELRIHSLIPSRQVGIHIILYYTSERATVILVTTMYVI